MCTPHSTPHLHYTHTSLVTPTQPTLRHLVTLALHSHLTGHADVTHTASPSHTCTYTWTGTGTLPGAVALWCI